MKATQEEICAQLRTYFYKEKMTQRDIAKKLGVTVGAVNTLLMGRRFGRNVARNWADAFGFSARFLMFGEGSLFEDDDKPAQHVTQTAIGNSGVTIQQNGANVNGTTDEGAKEGYFMRLAKELMDKLVEKEARICCLERELSEYKEKEE